MHEIINNLTMLAKFSVNNYMGFPDKITWDLTKPRDYAFNSHLIKNGLVKNGIIYGINGSGKTSLGRAIFDIVSLADIPAQTDYSKIIYRGNPAGLIDFEYQFAFDGNDDILYTYSKDIRGTLIKESLIHNGIEVFNKNGNKLKVSMEFAIDTAMQENLANNANSPSILKFIIGTFPLTTDHYLLKLKSFINSMLWFRCLDERNFIGIDNGIVHIEDYIIKKGYLSDFAEFIQLESEQKFDFSPTTSDVKQIFCKIGDNIVPFFEIMSTGTRALELLFYWIKRMQEADIKFVFIDEFDAFYHFVLSINVCRSLFNGEHQVFLSSHNTMLLGNDFLRPDCGFYLRNNKIDALCDCTNRGELRQGHNIEKMYRAGAFDYNN